MKNPLATTIKELAEIYDTNSLDTFVSIYVSKATYKSFLKRRESACEHLLEKEEQDNFNKTMEKIHEFLDKNHDPNIAIFASEKHGFFKSVEIPITINNLLIVDSSPYIRPLARIADEWESFSLVLLNSHQAKIFSVSLGNAEKTKSLSSDIMNKHKKGGWSQARFQRLRKGASHEFFKEVQEYLEHHADKQIILAGPGTAKIEFKNGLPKHVQDLVIDTIDSSMDESDLINESIKIISDKEEKRSKSAVMRLKEEILKDGLAVYGFDDTLKAVQNGQVDILIVEKDYNTKGCLCEHCQILNAGPIKDCPICGGETTEADVIEEIIEFAERTDAVIEFTNDEEISKLGHIGGLLRFKLE